MRIYADTSTIGQLTKHYQEHSIHVQQQQILSLQTQAVLHEKYKEDTFVGITDFATVILQWV